MKTHDKHEAINKMEAGKVPGLYKYPVKCFKIGRVVTLAVESVFCCE